MRHHSQITLHCICQSRAYHWSGDSWGITYACSWFALPRRSWVSVGTVSKSLEDEAGSRGKASAKTDTWRGDKIYKTKQNTLWVTREVILIQNEWQKTFANFKFLLNCSSVPSGQSQDMLRFLNIPSTTLTNSIQPHPKGGLDCRPSCVFITDRGFHQ